MRVWGCVFVLQVFLCVLVLFLLWVLPFHMFVCWGCVVSKVGTVVVYWFLFLITSFFVVCYPVFGFVFSFLVLLFVLFVYYRSLGALKNAEVLSDLVFTEACLLFAQHHPGFVAPVLIPSSSPAFRLSSLWFPFRAVFVSAPVLSLSPEVRRPLFAHELGHLLSAKSSVLSFLSRSYPLFGMFFAAVAFFSSWSTATVFGLFMVCFFVFKFVVLFLLRRQEFLADKFAFEVFGSDFTAALVTTAAPAGVLFARPFWWFWFSTHPSFAARLAKLNSYSSTVS